MPKTQEVGTMAQIQEAYSTSSRVWPIKATRVMFFVRLWWPTNHTSRRRNRNPLTMGKTRPMSLVLLHIPFIPGQIKGEGSADQAAQGSHIIYPLLLKLTMWITTYFHVRIMLNNYYIPSVLCRKKGKPGTEYLKWQGNLVTKTTKVIRLIIALLKTEISRLNENYTDLIPFSDELRGTSQPHSAKI